jgi:hypothetical protein
VTIEIRNFQQGDCGQIKSRHPVKTDRDAYHYAGMEDLSWTMLEDGKPIAAWGMQPHEEGVATVWSDFSDRALTEYPVSVAKNVKRRLEEHIKKLHLHRVQSMIMAGDDVSIHWIEWLGFHYEAPLEQDMEDFDILMFARLVN